MVPWWCHEALYSDAKRSCGGILRPCVGAGKYSRKFQLYTIENNLSKLSM